MIFEIICRLLGVSLNTETKFEDKESRSNRALEANHIGRYEDKAQEVKCIYNNGGWLVSRSAKYPLRHE